jgi:hypothetical protein
MKVHCDCMPETIEKDDSVEKLNNLSDEEIEERADRAFNRFKDKLREYSSE